MIEKFKIKNFKSIKDIDISCKRINLFIGEPNTGKSNILEALGFLCWIENLNNNRSITDFVRAENTGNLFYDELIDQEVCIEISGPSVKDSISTEVEAKSIGVNLTFDEGGNLFKGYLFGYLANDNVKRFLGEINLNYQLQGNIALSRTIELPLSKSIVSFKTGLDFIKFYRFHRQEFSDDPFSSFLKCPDGTNLFSVVMRKEETRKVFIDFFENCGLQVVFKRKDKIFEIQKEKSGEIFNLPYTMISDTLQGVIFHIIAIESNQNAVITFEEPEAKSFPFYTKILAEKIAFDEKNQYFLTTHNPYFLSSVIEKTPKESINVFITYTKDYVTYVKCLNENELSELISYDPFLNLNKFIEEEEK